MRARLLPLLASVVLTATLLTACGGASTADVPVINPEVAAFQASVGEWMLEWREAGIPILDRDLYRCYGPSDPVPPPAPPDPSGHSNAAISCAQAATNIQENLPRYRELTAKINGLTSGSNHPQIEEAHEALLKLHQVTLRIHEDAVAALNRNDLDAVALLKQRYKDVEEWNVRLALAMSLVPGRQNP